MTNHGIFRLKFMYQIMVLIYQMQFCNNLDSMSIKTKTDVLEKEICPWKKGQRDATLIALRMERDHRPRNAISRSWKTTGGLIRGRNHKGLPQPCEDIVRRQLSAIQEESSPEPDHAGTLIRFPTSFKKKIKFYILYLHHRPRELTV